MIIMFLQLQIKKYHCIVNLENFTSNHLIKHKVHMMSLASNDTFCHVKNRSLKGSCFILYTPVQGNNKNYKVVFYYQ